MRFEIGLGSVESSFKEDIAAAVLAKVRGYSAWPIWRVFATKLTDLYHEPGTST